MVKTGGGHKLGNGDRLGTRTLNFQVLGRTNCYGVPFIYTPLTRRQRICGGYIAQPN